jgi:glycosyltransferase involved in cell wall biosynthesis
LLRDAAAVYPLNKKIKYTLVDILLQEEKYEEAMNVFEEAMIAFGIDDDTLTLALGIREKIGPKEIAGGCTSSAMTNGMAFHDNKQRSTISVCIIVKNEEKNIAGCLHSLKPLVDEMIVVETGSTDRTKEIAIAFGAKVFDFTWTGDFSEARNFSLSKASGDWILVMDADEIIAPFDQDVLREMLNKPALKAHSAFSITSRNYVAAFSAIGWKANDGSYIRQEAGTGWYPSAKSRIFPNNPHIRFQYPVHEFVEFSIQKLGIPIYKIDVPVHHYGKLHGEKVISKGEDYYIMGKMKLSQRGENDPVALYELAVQASELQKFDEALDYWMKLSRIRPDVSESFFGAANSCYRLGKFEDALDLLEKALQIDNYNPRQREVGVLYATCSLRLGKAEVSIPVIERILRDDPEFPMGMLMLSLAYCVTGNKKSGKHYLEQLMGKGVYFRDLIFDLINFLLSSGQYAYTLSILDTVTEIDKNDTRFAAMLSQCREMMQPRKGK